MFVIVVIPRRIEEAKNGHTKSQELCIICGNANGEAVGGIISILYIYILSECEILWFKTCPSCFLLNQIMHIFKGRYACSTTYYFDCYRVFLDGAVEEDTCVCAKCPGCA